MTVFSDYFGKKWLLQKFLPWDNRAAAGASLGDDSIPIALTKTLSEAGLCLLASSEKKIEQTRRTENPPPRNLK